MRFLRDATMTNLRKAIFENLDLYRNGSFDFLAVDESHYFEGGLGFDSSALLYLNSDTHELNEVADSEAVFLALKELAPYNARDLRMWVYLTHTELLPYCKRRWPIPASDEEAVKFINAHYFGGGARGIERDNAISRLWWMGYICNRVSGLTLSEALKAFLYRSDVRANILERPTISQSLTVFSAFINELKISLDGDGALFERERFRRVMRAVNLHGGVALLDSLPEVEVRKLIRDVMRD